MVSVAFHDLPAVDFPVVMVFFVRGGREVHRITVDGPSAVMIPALGRRVGQPVGVRIEYATGRTEVVEPPAVKG